MTGIPLIDVAPLFGGESSARSSVDQALFAAAREVGFLGIRGLPREVALGREARARLLAIFSLGDADKRRLYRRKFAPENRNVYRGWFPLQPGNLTSKEGIDLGGDVAYGAGITATDDPLREASALPQEQRLPAWRAEIAAYYRAMER